MSFNLHSLLIYSPKFLSHYAKKILLYWDIRKYNAYSIITISLLLNHLDLHFQIYPQNLNY